MCDRDEIKSEESLKKKKKSLRKQLFSTCQLLPHFTGAHCVYPGSSWGKNWHVYYSEGAEWNSNSSGGKTAILQLSDCVIWAFKKAGLELVYCQTHSPGRQKDLFPPCLCVISPSEKLFSAFSA